MTELADLVGLHMLDAVDFETVAIPAYEGSDSLEDARTCRFRLDSRVFAAVENPDDGYRSSMRDLVEQPNAKMANIFPAMQVLAMHRKKSDYHDCDLLDLVDTTTGKVVLTVGTDNSDDYYPSFVAIFSPEHMKANA